MIENLYLNIGNVKVKQNISIPIGIDHTSFWQMFFLYSHEEEYMPLLICSDKVVVRNLHSAKSLIDYISVKMMVENLEGLFMIHIQRSLRHQCDHATCFESI